MRRILSALGLAILIPLLTLAPANALVATSPAAASGDVTIMHNVTCTGDVNPPTRSGNAVSVSGAVECTGSVDVANTYITVQIYENGAWRNYGNVTSTSSTARTLILSDGATLKPGTWQYRGRIHREAFHGNWGSNDWYGPGQVFTA